MFAQHPPRPSRPKLPSALPSALMLMLMLASALLPSSSPAAPLDRVRETGVLRVALYRDFPPYSWEPKNPGETNSDTGSPMTGIDAEIAQQLAHRIGVKLEIMPLTAGEDVDSDLRNAVWRGSVVDRSVADLLLHVPMDGQLALRNDLVVLFSPYYTEQVALAAPQRLSSLADLDALLPEDPSARAGSLAVELDSLSDLYLSGALGGRYRDSLHRFLHWSELPAELSSGRYQAVAGGRGEVSYALFRAGLDWPISQPQSAGLRVTSWPVGMAVKQNSRDLAYALGDALTEMTADGTLEAIFRAYHVPFQSPTASGQAEEP